MTADGRRPVHSFVPMYANVTATYNMCKAEIDGRVCTKPATHPCHTGYDDCKVCEAGSGNWTECTCDAICGEKPCRHSIFDTFDYREVPVPKFREDAA